MPENPINDCPDTPNCVSTLASSAARRIEPMPFCAPRERMLAVLKDILAGMERMTLVAETPDHLRAEAKSLLGFVDDVEFFFDRRDRILHMRSASRTGYWDLGVNRSRLQFICTELRRRCR